MRIGRASSRDAAGTTWRSPSASGPASTVTGWPSASGSRGKSLAASVRTSDRNRPASIFAWSSPISTVTVSRRELGERVDEEPRDEDRGPLALDVGRHPHADRELEVGARELDLRRR